MNQPPWRQSRRPTRTSRPWRQRPARSRRPRLPTGVEGAQLPPRVNLGSRRERLGFSSATLCRT
eukprot:6321843-Lingulodinium_polyedra.AAC.1